ncbi:MAG: hypothetical protein JWN02_2345 [Acidobacteria bacterium]|nr:hypothetical protein [Acidobacteriota bacterium]
MEAAIAPAPPQPEESFTAIDSPSLQFLPRGQEAQGWKLDQDPIVVPSARLTSYLGPEATQFVQYEVIDLTAGKYTALGNNGFASVEIFRFPDFVKAFGAYSLHKEGPMQPLAIQNESFAARHSVNVWRGPFYIRVVGGLTPDGNQSLGRLADFVAERMPLAPGKPAVFNFFPTTSRVSNSERYSAAVGFGQPFLSNSFQASFNINNDVVEGLIIPAANKQAAAKILDAYRQLYVRNGKLLDPITNLGEDSFTAEDRYLGRAVAFRLDRFVVAFNNFDDRQHLVDLAVATDQRILGTIRKQLVTAEKQSEGDSSGHKSTDTSQPAWTQRPRQ